MTLTAPKQKAKAQPKPKTRPAAKNGWQTAITTEDYLDENRISDAQRERKLNPRTPEHMVKAITDLMDIHQNIHDHDLPLHHRVQLVIRQRDDGNRKLVDLIAANSQLRQRVAELEGTA